ncbi:CRISPR system precrRNA processing endoribonuclease RAMP protein Cas6 [Thermobrachium celere]|uniref:CRISPR-associated protein Cas6 C-terminal domain-containing protein n=1 Tax=Thermobrachium celere DSM 8682 TaxID=941824 RepID=R7RUL6_9CLOT|nr:CRISPR system precrRNA processing endoribonuclease RAMP protein Cas6 [Thermobrachium celere]CDF59226.1 hypothetical protein TCEL_02294 [Thermobrachium celere DSM 8682]
MLKKVKFKFSLHHNNCEKKLILYGASYNILLDKLLDREEAEKIHGSSIFSLSPLYLNFNENRAEMYVATWNEEGIKLLNDIRDRLVFENMVFNFDLNGECIEFKFNSYQECSNDCFGLRMKDINNIPFSEIKDVELFINTPFFIKLVNKNYCYPDIDIICNCLKKNQFKIEGNSDEIDIKNLFPTSFYFKNIKVRYCGLDMYGCVGYIKIDITGLSLKDREVFIKQLVYSTYIGIGAKNAHGFGNINIKIDGKSVREITRG